MLLLLAWLKVKFFFVGNVSLNWFIIKCKQYAITLQLSDIARNMANSGSSEEQPG
jgi:hypothetical protein